MQKCLPFAVAVLTLVAILAASCNADTIFNGGFETGSLSPWFQDQTLCFDKCENWNVTSLDSHSGIFSATDVGDNSLHSPSKADRPTHARLGRI